MSADHHPSIPRTARQNLCDQVKEHAAEIEVAEFKFLNAGGKIAGHYKQVKTIYIRFIDGKEFKLSKRDFDELENFNFKLRPSRDDA